MKIIKNIVLGGLGTITGFLIAAPLLAYSTFNNPALSPYYQAAIQHIARYKINWCVSDRKIKDNIQERQLEERIVECSYLSNNTFFSLLTDFNKFRLTKSLFERYRREYNAVPENPPEPVNDSLQFMRE